MEQEEHIPEENAEVFSLSMTLKRAETEECLPDGGMQKKHQWLTKTSMK
jgi:hypothetical protein